MAYCPGALQCKWHHWRRSRTVGLQNPQPTQQIKDKSAEDWA